MLESTWIKFYKQGKLEKIITFEEIEKEIYLFSKKLKSKGLSCGNRVIVQLPNSIDTIITYLALKDLKAIAVPINPKESSERISFIVKDCYPKAMINQDGIKLFKSKDTQYSRKYGDKITTIIYTSGTTGQPKGVCLSWKNWEENAKSLIEHHHLNSTTIVATPLPLFHCNAHGFGMYSTFLAKSKLVLFDDTPDNFLDIINKEKVNVVSVVPSILQKLLENNNNWRHHSQLKYFLTAAAPLRSDLLKSIITSWHIKVVQGYGLTESTNFSCTLPIDLDPIDYKKIMFPCPSVGITIPGVKIKIEGKNRERKIGQILIEAKSNLLGYWGQELNSMKTVETGDLGYFKKYRNKKFYYLKGRLKELINRGGEKFYPLELEEEIRTLKLVKAFQIFSMPDTRMGEEVGLATLKSFDFSVLETIPLYRRPKKIYLVDKFFTTSTGKIQRKLMSQYCISGNAKVIWKYEN